VVNPEIDSAHRDPEHRAAVQVAIRQLLLGGRSANDSTTPDVADVDGLVASVRIVPTPGGTVLLREHDVADSIGIVVSGRVRIGSLAQSPPKVTAEVGAGAVVGELGALGLGTRTADVWTARDCVIGWLEADQIEAACRVTPSLGLALARFAASRSRALPISDPPRSVAIVGVGTAGRHDTPTGACRSALAAQVASLLSTTSSQPVLINDVGEAIRAAGDGAATVWTGAFDAAIDPLLRQTDRIIVVADSQDPPSVVQLVGRFERQEGPSCELVLVHPSNLSDPNGTARWLNGRGYRAHHHVSLPIGSVASQARIASAARRIVGRGIGLVLSGGGARGLAHLGAARVMSRHGIQFDYIGGSSMGAIMGGLIARFGASTDLEQRTIAVLRANRLERDFAVPRVSLFRGKALRAVLDEGFGDLDIEDLWTPWFCTSTNATLGQLDIHDRGRATHWSLATSAVPGLFPPIIDDAGSLHVDGGLTDNLPVEHMKMKGAQMVIAVDVGNRPVAAQPKRPSPIVGKRKSLVALPKITDTLQMSLGLASARRRAEVDRHIDVLLVPDVQGIGLTAFGDGPSIVAAGDRSASEAIASGRLKAAALVCDQSAVRPVVGGHTSI
jgi:NTE family protein